MTSRDARFQVNRQQLITDRVDEDDVWVVDFPQHLLNTSLRTSSSVHDTTLDRLQSILHSVISNKRSLRCYIEWRWFTDCWI